MIQLKKLLWNVGVTVLSTDAVHSSWGCDGEYTLRDMKCSSNTCLSMFKSGQIDVKFARVVCTDCKLATSRGHIKSYNEIYEFKRAIY